MFNTMCRPWICPFKTWLPMRLSSVLMVALIATAITPHIQRSGWPDAWWVNGVVAWLLFGALFCAVFYGASRRNCYVPRQHVPSIIQTTVPTVPDLSSLLCLLTSDGDSNPRDIRVRARDEGLWRINDAHYAYDPLHFVMFHSHREPDWHPNITGTTPVVVDGLSSEDEQQQPSEDEQQLDVELVVDLGRGGGKGRGKGRGRGRGRGWGKRVAGGRIARKVTTREYAAYFMHDRNPPINNTFTYGKRLYQEWVVD